MWSLRELMNWETQSEICGRWVPARPLNYRKKYLSLWASLKRAWLVFNGTADCFMWPEDEIRREGGMSE